MRKPKVHKLRHALPEHLVVMFVSECGTYLMHENRCRKTWRGVTCKRCLRAKASFERFNQQAKGNG